MCRTAKGYDVASAPFASQPLFEGRTGKVLRVIDTATPPVYGNSRVGTQKICSLSVVQCLLVQNRARDDTSGRCALLHPLPKRNEPGHTWTCDRPGETGTTVVCHARDHVQAHE